MIKELLKKGEKIRFFVPVLVIAAAVSLVSIACTKKTTSDDSLATGIKAQLYSDATTKNANITVAVKGGVATLAGDVPNSDVELQAMKIANGTAGLSRVDDQMKVNPSLGVNQPSSSTPPPPMEAITPQSPPVQNAPIAPAPAPAPLAQNTPLPPAPVQPQRVVVTVPAGERVSVQMIDSVDSAHNASGQVFRATLYAPVIAHGRTIFPAGTPVSVLLADAKSAGRIKGNSELELRLSQIDYRGRRYPVTSTAFEEQGKGRGKSTAVRTGIGAAAGALIGGLAGGGKGAGIGAVIGGGGTAGYQLATHGQQVRVRSETVLNFRLEAPLTVERI